MTLACTVFILGGLLGAFLAMRSHISALASIGGGVLSSVPIFLFGAFMPARTVAGARAMERVRGFEDFLDRVESDRYRRMIDSPEMFERFLPYAMAFGVEEKWARAFDDICSEPPEWYAGRWDEGFRPAVFAASMSRMSSVASTALGSGPRGSDDSGLSGGGGGGGGFGGGGGGGW